MAVNLERLYTKLGVQVWVYPLRGRYINIRSGCDSILWRTVDPEELRPPPVFESTENLVSAGANPDQALQSGIRPLRRSYALAGDVFSIPNRLVDSDECFTDINTNRSISIPSPRKPARTLSPKTMVLLLQLNSAIRPGLSESDFKNLFTRCICGLIMTRKAFKNHYCVTENLSAPDEVIEITDNSD